jgi:hypothetical protein
MADQRDTQDERDQRATRDAEQREREQAERGFKVEDRRRFTAEGQARSDPEAKETPAHGGAPPSSGGERHSDERPESAELSFTSFVVGIASQAFVFLGVMPDPQGGSVARDLSQAKAMIDILSMLSEKTRGNLDEQEAHMMSEMLYELRMLYVKELRGGSTGGKS